MLDDKKKNSASIVGQPNKLVFWNKNSK